jgi:hypothetical protein
MAQLYPSSTFLAQAVVRVKEFQERYARGDYKDQHELVEAIRTMVTEYTTNVGRPITDFEPVVEGEPLLSDKFNRLMDAIQNDINLLQDQATTSKAAAIFMHNYAKTEVLKAQRQNAQLSNKIKTLQLYTNAQDANLIIFGDYFKNQDFIDVANTPVNDRANLQHPGFLTLGPAPADQKNPLANAIVSILNTSNGFQGNNQELTADSSSATLVFTDVNGDKQPDYTFIGETQRNADIKKIVDQDPTTWFEYEYYKVSDTDRALARDYNFSYKDDSSGATQYYDWAKGPDGSLQLHLSIKLDTAKAINSVTVTPYGMKNNKNHPVRVDSVETSVNGTDWILVNPQNVWIANDANLESARIAPSASVGRAVFLFDQRTVLYVRVKLSQPNPMEADIGHIWWQVKRKSQYQITDLSLNSSPFAKSVLSDDPHAFWRFGELSGTVVRDSSGNTRALQLDRDISGISSWGLSMDGNAGVKLDGLYGASIGSVNQDSLDYRGLVGSEYTIEFLYRGTELDGVQKVFSQEAHITGNARWIEVMINDDGTVTMMNPSDFSHPQTDPNVGQIFFASSLPAYAINDGDIHHVACVRNGTSVKIYIDGSDRTWGASVVNPTDIPMTVGTMYVHRNQHDSPTSPNGVLDELIVYSHALSPARINEHVTLYSDSVGSGATPASTFNVVARDVGGERTPGPTPPLSNPGKYYDMASTTVPNANPNDTSNRLIQIIKRIELFRGKRWAIGIRDVSVDLVTYRQKSTMVSKPFRINGIVDRVAIEADTVIPTGFSESDVWVKFFVSPDNGLNWYQISRIQDDYLGIPEIIAFNDPLPEEFRENGIKYYTVNKTVDTLRVKIELSRPATSTSTASATPIVHNYRLKVRKR